MGGSFVWGSSRLLSGTLLFSIYICDLFLFTNDKDITSYADDNIVCPKLSKTNLALEKFEQCFDSLLVWFQKNGMKTNADKCHFLVSTRVC